MRKNNYYLLSDLVSELSKLPPETIANKDCSELIESLGEFIEVCEFDLLAIEQRPSNYDEDTIALLMGLRAIGIEENKITIVSLD